MNICDDNRFEIIEKAKEALLDSTNIEQSPDEMKVLDNFLFRCWQMGWLDKYESKKNDSWIPCSERLPEKNKAVLVYVLDAYEIAYLDDAEDWIHCMGTFYKDEVEAWMPLPPAFVEGVKE